MDSFNVIISPKALSQLNSYIDYLQFTLLSEQAARNVWQDALETRDRLSSSANALKLCSHPVLKKMPTMLSILLDIVTLCYTGFKVVTSLLMPYIIICKTMRIFLQTN